MVAIAFGELTIVRSFVGLSETKLGCLKEFQRSMRKMERMLLKRGSESEN
jgi:hypothetical protein